MDWRRAGDSDNPLDVMTVECDMSPGTLNLLLRNL